LNDHQHSSSKEHEINVLEILRFLYVNKTLILLFSAFLSILFGLYSLKIPDQYRSEIVVIPTESSSTSNVSSLGGLASLAGVQMSTGPNQTQIALAVLNSRSFLVDFIEKHQIYLELFPDNLNEEDKEWSDGLSADDIANTFRDIYSVSSSQDIYYFSIDWQIPEKASLWVNLLIEDLNSHMQNIAILQYEESIGFLKDQLKVNNVQQIENVLFKQIEEQTKNIMIANVKKEYAFKVLDPAITPLNPYSPNRPQLIVLGFFLGLIISSIFLSVYSFIYPSSRLIKK
tara:strand:+ start:85 stop:942 length:858 start_codon:yes stop_codon:yes gene_type:complete